LIGLFSAAIFGLGYFFTQIGVRIYKITYNKIKIKWLRYILNYGILVVLVVLFGKCWEGVWKIWVLISGDYTTINY